MAMSLAFDSGIVIIGGSIAGLIHALVLKSLGYNVCILESRSDEQMQARAAGLSLWSNAQSLIAQYAPNIDLSSIVVRNREIHIMDGNGKVLATVPVLDDVRTSSWTIVHSLFKKSCEKEVEGHGVVQFEAERIVWAVTEEKDLMRVAYKTHDGTELSVLANLVIAADGARSAVRGNVLRSVKSEYSGYLAWRGNLRENRATDELRAALTGTLLKFMFDGGYLLAYLTPNDSGSMKLGDRLIEWCWYDPCEAGSPVFCDFMTDANGKLHNVTMPAGTLRPEAWEAQLSRRKGKLSPLWYNIFTKSDLPLLTAIHSFDNPKANFFEGKLLLAGEAYTQIRPHLGASCDIAALQALTLAKVLHGEMSLKKWETNVAQYATKKAVQSNATGVFGMTGQWPEGFVPSSEA